MTSTADDRVPVLIVGGSLVGLSASLFLGRLGIRHTLVEKHPDTSSHPRGRGNNLRTMELYRAAGAEPLIRQAASVLADNHGILQAGSLTGDDAHWLFRRISPGGRLEAISPSGWCLCSQNDLEPVLLGCARRLGGDIRFNTELVSFTQDRDGVTATLLDRATGERREVRAGYLLAADGPRSSVRRALDIGQSGRGELFANVSITFRAKRLAEAVGDRRFIACYLTDPDAGGVLLPVDNQENWVFHAPWKPEDGETLEEFTDERCATHIRAAVGVPDLDVMITGKAPWRAAERVADRYADGRVLLAGDAVHEMSPTGAFGSNTGIQDAHNAAWKLAAVIDGWAGPELLETYEAERRPVAVATSERASARSAEHSHPGYAPPAGGGPQKGVLVVALGYRYPRGAVLGADPDGPVVPQDFEPTGEPGGRAPHLWLTAARQGERRSTLDLYERSLVLLSGDGEAGAAWQTAARAVAERLSVPLDAHRLGTGPHADLTPQDGADWAAAHGTAADGAVLVRPDGFVAWRASGAVPDPEEELTRVLRELLRLG
ncbi:FAD-dependent monooxygenase [Streptomyces sp. SL13]|uniref:FAD-dependent monooxygenase n=1 Tax=Streptantibioticus silvisoli TaxID=2705255 RepID=A0AA90H6X8_9ACTN|nr:FAD-dependent monooxygenase [Streptantibioticus silvisoli]MDI5961730.1 FAD-dependent monooxygenase [Streptantibioticus silvisoli]MDI5972346.1 FAD-dependent monooxygenase [Streptantibioticus silvisoli]